ncbi:hypothetical protein NUW54_g12398 [Trametes sanguinea]|uniref:Uncharacterized protein n=1 Tax=Trametes sanguinea TaxID=158606 RepID=A0ACC1MYD7_9APHY|nr:hypothetical protein NUW54_g12398 [Trametes sanguinea]
MLQGPQKRAMTTNQLNVRVQYERALTGPTEDVASVDGIYPKFLHTNSEPTNIVPTKGDFLVGPERIYWWRRTAEDASAFV